MVRVIGVEPIRAVWKTDVLPLNTTLAWSRIPESNRSRTDTNGEHDLRADAAVLVESPGNAPGRSACKAKQQPSASDPKVEMAGRQRIERCPSVLESERPPWPATCSAAYRSRTGLTS